MCYKFLRETKHWIHVNSYLSWPGFLYYWMEWAQLLAPEKLGWLISKPTLMTNKQLSHDLNFTISRLRSLLVSHRCLVAQPFLTLANPWPVACQASLSMGFPRHKHWGGLPFPCLEDLPGWGIEPTSPALAGIFFTLVQPPQLLPYKFLSCWARNEGGSLTTGRLSHGIPRILMYQTH